MGHPRISGLSHRRDSSGRITYFTDTKLGPRPGVRVARTWSGLPREEAEKRHRELVTAIRDLLFRRKHGMPAAEPEVLLRTFRSTADAYLTALRAANRKPETIARYARDVAWAQRFFGNRPIRDIATEDAEALRVFLQESHLAHRSQRNVEHTTSQVLEFAANREWCSKNPFPKLMTVISAPVTRKDATFRKLHPRADERFLAAVGLGWQSTVLAVALYTGARATAVASLRLEDVDLTRGFMRLAGVFAKTIQGHQREDIWLPISRHLRGRLEVQYRSAQSQGSPWLFPCESRGRKTASGHIAAGHLSRIALRAARALGYSGANFHSLRAIMMERLRTSNLARHIDDAHRDAREIAGHKSHEAAKSYYHVNTELLARIVAAMDDWLDEQFKSADGIIDLRDRLA